MIRVQHLIRRQGEILYLTSEKEASLRPIGLWDEVSLTHRHAGAILAFIESIQPGGLYTGLIKSIGVPGIDRLYVEGRIQFHEEFIHVVVLKG